MMKDYYGILGLPKDASESEIKKAYRQQALKYHPDRNPNSSAEEMFVRINDAYNFLMNPVNRESLKGSRHKDPYYKRNPEAYDRWANSKKRNTKPPPDPPSNYEVWENKVVSKLATWASKFFNWMVLFIGFVIIFIPWISYYADKENPESKMSVLAVVFCTIIGVAFIVGIRKISKNE